MTVASDVKSNGVLNIDERHPIIWVTRIATKPTGGQIDGDWVCVVANPTPVTTSEKPLRYLV